MIKTSVPNQASWAAIAQIPRSKSAGFLKNYYLSK